MSGRVVGDELAHLHHDFLGALEHHEMTAIDFRVGGARNRVMQGAGLFHGVI
jgi:hypothetical protein